MPTVTNPIQKPITASAIKTEFAYVENLDPTEFELGDYRGVAVRYPNGWRDVNTDELILSPSGEPIYLRLLPQEPSQISFSDFYGGIGYFQPYPDPVITITSPLSNQSGYSNYSTSTHSLSVSVDWKKTDAPDWRPQITRTVIRMQWQTSSNGTTWTNDGAPQEWVNRGSATITRTDNNGMEGTYYYRVKIEAESYAENDDDIFSNGGVLGPLRIVGTDAKTSGYATTTLTPYNPSEPRINFNNTVKWSRLGNDAPYEGEYVIEQRSIDDVLIATPRPVLSATNSAPVASGQWDTSDLVQSRNPTNTFRIEWEFLPPADKPIHIPEPDTDTGLPVDVVPPVWEPISRFTDEFLYDDSDTYIGFDNWSFTDNGVTANSDFLTTYFSGFKFRAKVYIEQALENPTEVKSDTQYGSEFYLNVFTLTRDPTWTLTGSGITVNGGTIKFDFTRQYTGSRNYTYDVYPSTSTGTITSYTPAHGEFDSTLPVNLNNLAEGTREISLTTKNDGDTSTEYYLLVITDTDDLIDRATKVIRINYGQPAWYWTHYDNTVTPVSSGYEKSTTEGYNLTLYAKANNIPDSEDLFWKYVNTYNDGTQLNDFIDRDTAATYNHDTWYRVDMNSWDGGSNDTVVRTRGKIRLQSVNDSPFGGQVGNFEKFTFYLQRGTSFGATPPSSISGADTYKVKINDLLEYRYDWLGESPNDLDLTIHTTSTYAGVISTSPVSGYVRWNNPQINISWSSYGAGTIYYRWICKPRNGSTWRDLITDNAISTSGGNYTSASFRPVTDTSTRTVYLSSNTSWGSVKDQGPTQLYFDNIKTTYSHSLGYQFSQIEYSIQYAFVAANGSTLYTEPVGGTIPSQRIARVNIGINDRYIDTGIYSVGGYTQEGSVTTPVNIRSYGIIGQKVKLEISDPYLSGYLIDFPKFGPQYPHGQPQTVVEYTVTSNNQNIDMGGWLYHSYGLQQSLPSDREPYPGMNKLRVRATVLTGYTDGGNFRQRTGDFSVRDNDPTLWIGSGAFMNSYGVQGAVKVKPGDSFQFSISGRNLRCWGPDSYGVYPRYFGVGFTIREWGSRGGEIGSAGDWFTPTNTYEDADNVYHGQNRIPMVFSEPDAWNADPNDYFTFSYARKQGIYVLRDGPITINVNDSDEWFEPKKFYIQPHHATYRTGAPGGSDSLIIELTPRVDKPVEYGITFKKVGSGNYREDTNESLIVRIQGNEEPAKLDHVYTIEVDGVYSGGGQITLPWPPSDAGKINFRLPTGSAGKQVVFQVWTAGGPTQGTLKGEIGFPVDSKYPPLSVSLNDIVSDVQTGGSVPASGKSVATVTGGASLVRTAWSVNISSGSAISNMQGPFLDDQFRYGLSMNVREGTATPMGKKVTGTVSLTVTDADGNQASASAAIRLNHNPPPPPLGLSISPQTYWNPSRSVAQNSGATFPLSHTFTATASGGTGSYSYSWTTSFSQVGTLGSVSGRNTRNLGINVEAGINFSYRAVGQQATFIGQAVCTAKDTAGATKSQTVSVSVVYTVTAGGGPGCPTTDMLIRIGEEGNTTIPAGDLVVGDLVWTQHEDTREWGSYPVTAITLEPDMEIREVVFDDGTRFTGSYSHKFATETDWIASEDLVVGDVIQDKTVTELNDLGKDTVVRITVEQAHTYIVADVLSHNKLDSCPTPDMMIMTGENQFVAAGDLKAGDTVWTKHELTKKWGHYTITSTDRLPSELIRMEFDDGFVFTGSPSHTFEQDGAWVRAENIEIGEEIQGRTVVSNSRMQDGVIIRFEVDDAHTYMVGDFWSHNAKAPQ